MLFSKLEWILSSWNNVIALLLKVCPWSLLEMTVLVPSPGLLVWTWIFKKIPIVQTALLIPGPSLALFLSASLLLLSCIPLLPVCHCPLPHWSSFSPSCISVSPSQTSRPGTQLPPVRVLFSSIPLFLPGFRLNSTFILSKKTSWLPDPLCSSVALHLFKGFFPNTLNAVL